ncbi:hypothetical protein [Novosphingobium aquae]|uniref:Uncharacterized protein n=1 Tax=Novosphingobium aquae TaxID=3133435 RepID=A0ABU8SC33_9SPHN
MTILRTAVEVAAFLATPLGREVEGILAPHLERLAEFELEDIAAIAVDETPQALGLDPDAYEYRTEHHGWTEGVFIISDDGFGWIVLTRT